MLVKLTSADTNLPLFVEASIILAIIKEPNDIATTTILTAINTQRGPITWKVTEAPATIAQAVNEAHQGKFQPAKIALSS